MDPEKSIVDTHTVFCTDTSTATAEQLGKALVQFFQDCSTYFNVPLERWGSWDINVVVNKANKTIGVCYVYFFNPEAYYVITGMNRDGTRKTREVTRKEANYEGYTQVGAWEKEGEGVEGGEGKDMVLVYDDNRVVTFPEVTVNDRETGEPKNVTIKIQKCMISKDSLNTDDYIFHTLFGFLDERDSWVKPDHIRRHFSKYCSSKKSRNELSVVFRRNKIFVNFMKGTNDSHFALFMSKKLVVTEGNKKATVFFGYARCAQN